MVYFTFFTFRNTAVFFSVRLLAVDTSQSVVIIDSFKNTKSQRNNNPLTFSWFIEASYRFSVGMVYFLLNIQIMRASPASPGGHARELVEEPQTRSGVDHLTREPRGEPRVEGRDALVLQHGGSNGPWR